MNKVKGTKDYLPDEMRGLKRVLEIIEKNFRKFGFDPMDTPRIEYFELFSSRIGEDEKDIFKFEDKSGRVLALRFDQTASLYRVFQNYSVSLPFKRYSIGKSWRYEEPQKGRYREFIQADVDIVGVASPIADAEVIACMYSIFKELGLKVKVSVNSRKLIDDVLLSFGVRKENLIAVLRILDKRDKIGDEGVKKLLKEEGFDPQILDLIASIDLQNVESESAKELMKLMEYLDKYGINYEFNPFIVRGLDYYTSFVYEIVSDIGTVSGGGRYDKMIMQNGEYVPACGMSIGVSRLYDLIKDNLDNSSFVDYFIAWVGNNFDRALNLAIKLREKYNVDLNLVKRSLSKQLDYASKRGITKVIIVGNRDKYTVKNLITGEQEEVEDI